MLHQFLSKFAGAENYNEKLLRDLKQQHKEVVLYGAGYCGHETLAYLRDWEIPVADVCDDMHDGELLDGVPIHPLSAVKPEKNLAILVTCGYNKGMIKKLEACGLLPYYVPADFGRYDMDKERLEYFLSQEAKLEEAYNLLADDRSRDIFRKLIEYRIKRTPGMMEPWEEAGQYFPKEKQLDLRSYNDSFMDCGSFDGDTIRGFIDYVGTYGKIFAIEASKKNFAMLQEKTKSLVNIEYHNVGIWREKGNLHFADGDANNSFASDQGNAILSVDSIDDILAGRPVSFIKMDIEGVEYDALLGAERTIQKYHPAMAVCAYHKVEDLFRLQLLIEHLSSGGGYQYYLRHYAPTVIETVLYAVPCK